MPDDDSSPISNLFSIINAFEKPHMLCKQGKSTELGEGEGRAGARGSHSRGGNRQLPRGLETWVAILP